MITVSDGTKINCYLDDFTDPWEERDTIAIWHGCGDTARMSYRMVPGLARRYKVLRFDERGFGESSLPPGRYEPSMERCAEDALNVIDELGIEKIHFFGFHSGGWVGAMFATSYPDRIKSLTLCDSPYKGPGLMWPQSDQKEFYQGEEGVATIIRKMGFREWAKGDGQSLACELNVPPKMREWSDNERGKNSTEVQATRYGWSQTYEWWGLLAQIKVPTLVLTGAQARFCTPEMASEMYRQIPGAQLAVLPNASSSLNFYNAERCVETLLGFLQALD